MTDNVAVVGPGAIGALLSHALNKAGMKPYLIFKDSRRAEAVLREGGIKLQTPVGDVVTLAASYTSYEEISTKGVVFDLIFITTKNYDFPEALSRVRTSLSSKGFIVTCQNGLFAYEQAVKEVGKERVAALVLSHGVYREKPTHYVWVGGSESYVGSEGLPKKVLSNLAGKLSLLNVKVVDDIKSYMWLKLAVNAAINPLTAVLGVKNRALVEDEVLRNLADKIVDEVVEVANALGVKLPSNPYEEYVKIAMSTGDNYSSMLQDIINKRKTEVDFINGEVVRKGRLVNVKTPVNETLLMLVKAKERQHYRL
ncbi:MAG: hypothetical protein B7O98_07180 [Zestosphaera tikiterensis]|uniref:2-dehydropantoate 2-reductase n=1 Tax=Zestosphaera tikiterensis TaxID=1973259 RepID=A0A2R7Y4X0_9CREN|nr:MAG: hypothetical protein B7O98_07180 [Zestosphaera tikiterensis]